MSTHQSTSVFAPLTRRSFRWFWAAFSVSTTGMSMQTFGAQWFLVSTDDRGATVALVQAAVTLPLALLALPAGVLADRVDRRVMLAVVQTGALVVGAVLAVLAARQLLHPTLLLLLMVMLGSAYALTLTPFQSLVPDLLSLSAVPSAAALTSMGANIARIVGPALAGVFVATLGIPGLFALSSLASAFFVMVLLRWGGLVRQETRPERFLPAALSGLRYVRHSPPVLRLMLRSFWFTAPMMSLFALLPLFAARELGTSSGGYGALFACLGTGAVIGAMSLPRLRIVLTENAIVGLAFVVCGGVSAVMPSVHSAAVAGFCLLVAGWGWTTCLSAMAGAIQVYLPAWVRARGLAIYSVALFSGQAIGSIAVGALAQGLGLPWTFRISAAVLLGAATLALWLPIPQITGVDRSRAARWPDPSLPILLAPGDRPHGDERANDQPGEAPARHRTHENRPSEDES